MRRLLDGLDALFVEWIGALLMAATALIVFLQVVTRNLFGFTTVWGEEVPRYLVVLAVFLALGEGWRRGRNLRMTLLVDRFPPLAGRGAAILGHAVGLLAALYLFRAGAQLVLQQYQQQVTTGTSLNLPAFIPTAALPLGMAYLALSALVELVRSLLPSAGAKGGA